MGLKSGHVHEAVSKGGVHRREAVERKAVPDAHAGLPLSTQE